MDTSTLIPTTDTLRRPNPPRRLRTLEEKLRIVGEANERGASVAQVARRHGVNANLVFGWRRQHAQGVLAQHSIGGGVKLLPVKVSDERAVEPQSMVKVAGEGRIEITLARDIRITLIGAVAMERLEQVLAILKRTS